MWRYWLGIREKEIWGFGLGEKKKKRLAGGEERECEVSGLGE